MVSLGQKANLKGFMKLIIANVKLPLGMYIDTSVTSE